MSIQINVRSSQDTVFEASLLVSPVSNYSDGIDKGFRPAIAWALVRLPDNVLRSGVFNIKNESAEATAEEAITAARDILFTDEACICSYIVDSMLEEYEREV